MEYEGLYGLEGYVGTDDFKMGPPYQPHPQRNEAFQRFTLLIKDKQERERMNDLISEIPLAVTKEPVVRLRDLDIPAWQRNLGISDQQVKLMLAAHDRLRKEEA